MTEQQKREMGGRVAALRDAQGWTNEALARKSNLSVKTVSRVVNGRHEARVGTIEALAKAFRVPEREIRGDPPSPFGDGKNQPTQLDQIEAKLDRLLAVFNLDDEEDLDASIRHARDGLGLGESPNPAATVRMKR